MVKVSSSSRSMFSSSLRSNPVKRSSLLTRNCCLMAVYYWHAGKGTLLFPKIPYKSLENSRYETLRRKLKETAESNVLWSDFAHGSWGSRTRRFNWKTLGQRHITLRMFVCFGWGVNRGRRQYYIYAVYLTTKNAINANFPNQSPKLEVTRQGYYYYDFCFTDHKSRRSWWIYAETYIMV